MPQVCLDKFRETLEICDLQDLGFIGDKYTWRNHNHLVQHYVKERLDRAAASPNWAAKFPHVKVINSDPRHSDHRPVIV